MSKILDSMIKNWHSNRFSLYFIVLCRTMSPFFNICCFKYKHQYQYIAKIKQKNMPLINFFKKYMQLKGKTVHKPKQ